MAKSNVVVSVLIKAERSAVNKLAHELSHWAYQKYSKHLIDLAEKQKAADGRFDVGVLAPSVIKISAALQRDALNAITKPK